VGPIPWADRLGKEIVVRYGTGLATAGVWYSDANGRDSMRRVRNARPSWTLNVTEAVADNYVPTTEFQWLTDGTTTLSVITDRAQGGASMNDGELEFMIHRRLQVDDDRGVGEPLNETGLDGAGLVVRGVHRLSLALSASGAAAAERMALVNSAIFRPVIRYTPLGAGVSPSSWISSHTAAFSGIGAALPSNVAVLTLQSRGAGRVLLRLGHMAETADGPQSGTATVAVGNLFAGYTVTGLSELTLPGVISLSDAPVVTYSRADGSQVTLPVVPPSPTGPAFNVDLTAMQIRTFDVALVPLA